MSGAVVREGEAKEFSGDGVGFDVVEEGKDEDKKTRSQSDGGS